MTSSNFDLLGEHETTGRADWEFLVMFEQQANCQSDEGLLRLRAMVDLRMKGDSNFC